MSAQLSASVMLHIMLLCWSLDNKFHKSYIHNNYSFVKHPPACGAFNPWHHVHHHVCELVSVSVHAVDMLATAFTQKLTKLIILI